MAVSSSRMLPSADDSVDRILSSISLSCDGAEVLTSRDHTDRNLDFDLGLGLEVSVSFSASASRPNVLDQSQSQGPDLQNILRFIIRLS